MKYVSLHSHSTFSYGDGFGTVAEHVERVADLGYTALAFTEHGNTSSHAQLEKECRKRNVKPIFGCELYLAPTDPEHNDGRPVKTRKKFHQSTLAMNAEGYRNLNRIVSASWRDHFFQWPTTTDRLLREHSEGILVLSGCSDSHLSCTLLGGKELGDKRQRVESADIERARRVIEHYQDIFGEHYFLEVQRFPGLDRTCQLNPALAELARITGARLVASSDVHYPYPDQNTMQTVLHAAHRGGTVESADASWEYDILLTYPESDAEIHRDLVGTGLTDAEATDAIQATADISELCTVELPKNEPIKFPFPGSRLNGEENTRAWEVEATDDDGYVQEYSGIEEYVWAKIKEGWAFRAKTNRHMRRGKKKYVARIKFEMEQIVAKGFLDYFGMLSDSVQWAKDSKIPVGPARGSAAASLVCYLLRITEIDPMQFPNMLFSRFIDPNRLDLPDVDLDFADDRRDEVRQYLVRVYGADRVGNIGNFTRYRGKNSIDDVARVYRIPKWASENVKGLIVERSGGDARQSDSLEDTFEMFPKAKEMLEMFPNLAMAQRLEGNYRGLGVHAAGLVISNNPIDETCALYTRPKAGTDQTVSVIAYDKKDSEYLGMLKMDFLGLKTMGLIGIVLDLIGMDLEDLYRVPITEEKTLRAFTDNDLVGIFQFEGRATTIVNRDVVPTAFDHLADINALSRPGPLFSGMTADYVNVKHDREDRQLLHPIVDKITSWTYGQIVYQEQVLQILDKLAGFPAIRVGDIRRIISQKSGMQVMEQAYGEFRDGCYNLHGIDEQRSRKIWNYIATSSTYSFNQSHSVSYAMLAFWCQYLKQYFAKEFYVAALTKVGDGKDVLWRRSRLIQDAERHKIPVHPPRLLDSGRSWTVRQGGVMGGLMQVNGIGPVTADNILNWRKDMEVLEQADGLDWPDLTVIKGIGPSTIKKIQEFVSSDDPYGVNRTRDILEAATAALAQTALPQPTHHSTGMPQAGTHDVVWVGMARNLNYKDYVEATRARTGEDEAEIIATMKDPELRKSCVIQAYDEGDEDVYVRVNRWDFPEMKEDLEDLVKDQDVMVVVGRKRDGFGISIHAKEIYILKMEAEEDE